MYFQVFHLLQRKELREGIGRQALEGPSCITRDISLTHIELKAIGLEPDLPLVDNLVEEVDGLVVKEVKVELNASALTRQDCKLSDTPNKIANQNKTPEAERTMRTSDVKCEETEIAPLLLNGPQAEAIK